MSRTSIPELQSLRGIAAAIVLVHHCLMVFDTGAVGRLLAEVSLNAHAAVVVFFVLSGYVLTRSIAGKQLDGNTLLQFWLRRALRIYPALWFGVLAGLAYYVLLAAWPAPGTTAWFWDKYHPGEGTFARMALSFTGIWFFLLPVLWTIAIEIGASAFIPCFAWAVRQRARLISVIGVLALASFVIHFETKLLHIYLVDFAIGAGVLLLPTLSRQHIRVLLPVSVLVLMFFRQMFAFSYHDPFASLVEAVAAAGIVASLASGAIGWMRAKPLVVLGDWSYSVYLLHMPVMYALAKLITALTNSAPVTQSLLLLVGTTAATLLLSKIIYEHVEVPAIELGRRVFANAGLRTIQHSSEAKAIAK